MASGSSGVQQQQYQQQQQQQQQQPTVNNPHQCKDCGVYYNSAESLEVHVQYHNENLLNKWATQATTASSSHEETNNNNTSKTSNIKQREFILNSITGPADSSDSITKKSPEYANRTTPESNVNFGHPPTPQSYHSASSPYQNTENSSFSPGYQSTVSSNLHFPQYSTTDTQFFSALPDSNQQVYGSHEYLHKMHNFPYRYHPYQQQQGPYDRSQPQNQVSSSSPAYQAQPTPSPSPKQCDKCGFVCESASQLHEHQSTVHPPAPVMPLYQQTMYFPEKRQQQPQIKREDDQQSEILDLDSHKVHQVYQEEDKRQQLNGEINGQNSHSVSAMLPSWPPQPHPQQKMFEQDQQQIYGINNTDQGLFPNGVSNKMYEQKVFAPHRELMVGGTVTTTQNSISSDIANIQEYRAFEQLQPQPNAPVISSTQISNNTPAAGGPPTTKSANWKSNEARRPKTYNCTACNKWFTSSGHLKRHYNTTLHKNAVKSSGQPDPAIQPISNHHHPARETSSSREEPQSGSPGEDSRGEENSLPPQFADRNPALPGLLQQPPNGPYDRQPPGLHHTRLHSPMGGPMTPNLPPSNNGSPPNGDAGPSAATTMDPRGLLSSLANSAHHGFSPMAPPPPVPISMEGGQFQMYPNGPAPHVMQIMATNSPSIIGEFQDQQFISVSTPANILPESQPLPSFAQFHRYGMTLGYGAANVGGEGSVTIPYDNNFYTQLETVDISKEPVLVLRQNEDGDFRTTVLTSSEDPNLMPEDEENIQYLPENNNNNIIEVRQQNLDVKTEITTNSPPQGQQFATLKTDYEESTGSPLISSTVQTKQADIYKCFDCDKLFNKACYLTQHNKTFHCGEKPHKCSRCGKRFSCENQYEEHQRKHAGDKPYKCELCPKQFNHKTDLRRHMCLHTGNKPFTCETCGKGFIRKDHMLKHCETHNRKPHVNKNAGNGR